MWPFMIDFFHLFSMVIYAVTCTSIVIYFMVNNFLIYGHTTFSLTIYYFYEYLGLGLLLGSGIIQLWTLMPFLCGQIFFSLGYISRSGMSGVMVTLCLTLQGTAKLQTKAIAPFCISTTAAITVPVSPQLPQHLLLSVFFIISTQVGMK